MRKFKILGFVALVLPLLFALSACSSDSKTDSMTFANDEAEFTIYSDFNFKVKFLDDMMMIIAKNDTVSGKIDGVETAWNKDFTGEINALTSNSDTLKALLADVEELVISLVYDYDEDEVTISFPDAMINMEAGQAQAMMGGTYARK